MPCIQDLPGPGPSPGLSFPRPVVGPGHHVPALDLGFSWLSFNLAKHFLRGFLRQA